MMNDNPKKNESEIKKTPVNRLDKIDSKERMSFAATNSVENIYKFFFSSEKGLSKNQVEISRENYGENIVTHGKNESIFTKLRKAFINPFNIILICLAAVSTVTDIIWADPGEAEPTAVIIITSMIIVSGILKFVQEAKSDKAAAKLTAMIHTTTCIERIDMGKEEILLEEVVVGDIVHIAAGDMIPADVRVIFAKDLFISQSSLTGESEPVEKFDVLSDESIPLIESKNLAFMGTNVISGSAIAIVLATGNDTILGEMAKELNVKPPVTSFEKGVNSVSWVLIRYMLAMVPVVLFINGFMKGNWVEASLFALSIAVGLTPEMLPMIVTTCLAKGAVAMSKKKVIIKSLNSIQNLGSIDILCTDKTGTLTQDKIVLHFHLDLEGKEDLRILRYAYLNSHYQTGLRNLIDIAVINSALEELPEYISGNSHEEVSLEYKKIDEIPFDFERRRMSVVVSKKGESPEIITKGAVEEMINISKYVELNGEILDLTEEIKTKILEKSDDLNSDGMRVIAVARKEHVKEIGTFSVKDESEMILMGYLAFLDPPKETASAAIRTLKEHGVTTKILTGDNEKVAATVCKQVGLPVDHILMGADVEGMDDKELTEMAEKTTIFAKLSPIQKSRVVRLLRENGHSVGYMGDGINDASALKASDVGISVDNGVDIAKESAHVILLEKDLMVLEEGIIEGRKTYANMIKYIKMTASSNFGNIFSVLVASALLPFLPMLPIHLLLLNLIYDVSCAAIPWDNVDKEFLKVPRKWDASSISNFMLWFGPTSSVFDIITYLLMFYVICPAMTGGDYYSLNEANQIYFQAIFHAGWFVESMWTQTLVIHMIRTPKIPFVQSIASFELITLTFLGIIGLTIIPFTSFGTKLKLAPLPNNYFGWLFLILIGYMVLVTIFKKIYIKRYGELL